MKTHLFIYYSLLLLFTGQRLSAQTTQTDVSRFREIAGKMKLLKDVSYQYSMIGGYPGKQSDRIKGEVYVNNDKKLLSNNCDAFTMIYSQHWYYKADHRNKTLTIVNLDKAGEVELKKSIETEVFGNSLLNSFIDSVVLKYGIVKKLKEDGDTVKIELSFPNWMKLKRLDLAYDVTRQTLVNYKLFMSYQIHPAMEPVTETMVCSDFRKVTDVSSYQEENYFSIDKTGTIVLKKYSKYKLYTKL